MAKLLASLLFAFSTAALAQVELLYVAAADCGYCRKWEAQYLQHGKSKAALEWSGVRLTTLDIGSFRNAFSVDDAPAHLRPGLKRALTGRSSLRGTPWFALFVDGEVRAHGFGLDAFESRIQPAMRTLLREKT